MSKKLAAILFVFCMSACASSTIGPGAGAAEGTVKGDVSRVNEQAMSVFKDMKIQETGASMTDSGSNRRLTGKLGDSNVTVQMDSAPNSTTQVRVDASKNALQGNQTLAQQVLSGIVQKG